MDQYELTKDLSKEDKIYFNAHYTRCEFDDECSVCNNPTSGSYATGYCEYDGEVDDYICGKCAMESLPDLIKHQKEEYEALDKYI